MKTCSKCGVEKPLTDFPKRVENKDGHRRCCRECKKPAAGIFTKICLKCGITKPLTEFSKRTENKDGYRACCQKCNALPEGTVVKTCSKCGVEKPVTEFHKDSGAAGGFCCWCKTCQAVANRARLLKNPDKHRAMVKRSGLKSAYGITPEGKDVLIASQGGCCACCGDPFSSSRNAHVDHIHGSNPVIVRGILCPQCNVGLGNFKESPQRLAKATAYLLQFQK